jgi:hypothetical protein
VLTIKAAPAGTSTTERRVMTISQSR